MNGLFPLAISAALALPVMILLEFIKPFLNQFLPVPTDGTENVVRTWVIRIIVVVLSAIVLIQSGATGFVAQDPLLSQLPFGLAVLVGSISVVFTSGVASFIFTGASSAAQSLSATADHKKTQTKELKQAIEAARKYDSVGTADKRDPYA